jgi:hypothetical protein
MSIAAWKLLHNTIDGGKNKGCGGKMKEEDAG